MHFTTEPLSPLLLARANFLLVAHDYSENPTATNFLKLHKMGLELQEQDNQAAERLLKASYDPKVLRG